MRRHLSLPHGSRRVMMLAGLLLVVALVGGALFILAHHKPLSQQQQMTRVVQQVGKLIELPVDENPTLATVTDQAAVRKQPFFVQAQDGDKVLLYPNHHYAYLYRPNANKLIAVGPINGTVSYGQFTMAVHNGTADASLLDHVTTQLQNSFPYGKVVDKAPASRPDFPSTIVIPAKDADDTLAAQVADAIGGQIGILPIGESKQTSDLLIIVGKDYQP